MMHQQSQPLRANRGAQAASAGDLVVQVMHINQRIKIRLPESESLAMFYHKLCVYFELMNERNSSTVGLLYRRGPNEHYFVRDRADLRNDHLYYLYFREKPDKALAINLSPASPQGRFNNGIEESKKVRQSDEANGGWQQQQHNFGHSRMSSSAANRALNLASSQIEKVKRPKEEKKVLICPFETCLKEFSETGNLKTHMRTHTGERPFVCGQCDQQFITKGHLQAHELTHTGEKPFQCTFSGCSKRYSRAGRLKIHMRLHTGERPFICQMEGCEKAFREKGNLLTHMRIHNGQKPFKCDFADCDMSFTTQGHLTDHKRRHSGERPYVCEQCNDKFMRSSTLKIHMRRHTGEKPYKCDKCDRSFSESGNLRTHQKIHEDETSSIGKRGSRRSLGSSSAVVTPVTDHNISRRVQKLSRKDLIAFNKRQQRQQNNSNYSDPEDDEEEHRDDEPAATPLVLKTMPEVQLDFIQKQMASDGGKLTEPLTKGISLMRGGNHASSNEQFGRTRRIKTEQHHHTLPSQPIMQRGYSKTSGNAAHKNKTIHISQVPEPIIKEEEIKLPIHEPAGPPGLPAMFSDMYNPAFGNLLSGNNAPRFDFNQGGLTPLYHNLPLDNGAFNFAQTFANIQQFQHQQQQQQQQQQSQSLAGLSSLTSLMNNNGNPFSPTGMINLGGSSFSPKGFLGVGNNNLGGGYGNNQFLISTPTANDIPYNLRSNSKRGGNMIQNSSAQPNSFFGGGARPMDSDKKFLSLNQAGNQQTSCFGFQQPHQPNAIQKFSPQVQGLESPLAPQLGVNQYQGNNHLLAQQIYGGFQKAGQGNEANINMMAQNLQSLSARFNGNLDPSPSNGCHNQQQQQYMQKKNLFVNSNNTQGQALPQLSHNMSFNPNNGYPQINPQQRIMTDVSSSANANDSSKRASSGSRSQRHGSKMDDPQSFSNLASRFQGGAQNSENDSPQLIPPAVNTPHGMNMTEYQTNNFTMLAANKKNGITTMVGGLGISENSAFRKSPRVAEKGSQLKQQALTNAAGFSGSNTPRVNSNTTASEQPNFKLNLIQNPQPSKKFNNQSAGGYNPNAAQGNFQGYPQHHLVVPGHKGGVAYPSQGNANAHTFPHTSMGSANLGYKVGATPSPNNSNSLFDDLSSPKIIGGNTQLGAKQQQHQLHQRQ